MTYVGRFAPSPTGLLHAGSVAAALASWLDARAAGGRWLVRIEDLDTPRCVEGADRAILDQLGRLGLVPDDPPQWQSRRTSLYQRALDALRVQGRAYPCACTRLSIAAAWNARGMARERDTERVYPGTCRPGLGGKPPRAWRFLTQAEAAAGSCCAQADLVHWSDRRLGQQSQNVSASVGDFVLKRADGLWAYQLAVVVDDAAQGVTHVVRGEDLADNTPRQILLQRALGLPALRYLHTPLVLAADGHKLSKQNGAKPVDTDSTATALQTLCAAAVALGLHAAPGGAPLVEVSRLPSPLPSPSEWLALAVGAWSSQWPSPGAAA